MTQSWRKQADSPYAEWTASIRTKVVSCTYEVMVKTAVPQKQSSGRDCGDSDGHSDSGPMLF